jgi:UDP-2-acetamido-2,6-beta-L-arabino-hexul-4-ose reductase
MLRATVTGAHGFLGKNICFRLKEQGFEVSKIGRDDDIKTLESAVRKSDFVFHLAGENRSDDDSLFELNNTNYTRSLCDILGKMERRPSVLFSSTVKVSEQSIYGKTKLAAEHVLEEYAQQTGATVTVLRLPGVFGKWGKPNYNSVVATFCFNIARNLNIEIYDADEKLNLAHVDDVVDQAIQGLLSADQGFSVKEINKIFEISVGYLAEMVQLFRENQNSLYVPVFDDEFQNKLYTTYLSYVEHSSSNFPLQEYSDERGRFVECFKSSSSGQVSFFTVRPKMTRGRHYHHSKFERFIVVQGHVVFKFINIIDNSEFLIEADAKYPQIVNAQPGWQHEVSNTADTEALIMVWANEVFDNKNPDTHKIEA